MSSLGNRGAPRDALSGWSRRHASLCCGLLCALWFGLAAGLRPLAIPDEGRYVGVAWEMLRSGDWLVPSLNGAPFFHKPPLFYWITAASMAVFGPEPWTARLGAVASTTIAATVLFAFVRRWQSPRAAWTTVLVLATTPLFYGSSQYANLDPLVASCIAVAILCGADAVLRQEAGRPAHGACTGAFVAAACGVLAKGLIGLVLPLLVLTVWALATGRSRRMIRIMCKPWGWAAFLAIAAPWFIAMQARFADFGHYFFIVQHVSRFVSTGFNNAQPPWFYLALLALGMAPWSPWMLKAVPPRSPLFALMTSWVAVVVVFFSVPLSKPIGYILPALPALAWLLANAVGRLSTTPSGRGWTAATAVLAAGICLGTTVTLHFRQPKSQSALAAQLRTRRLPAEPVFFIGNYYFDLPFYARLDTPVCVVDDWSVDEVAKDSWRRELVDAEMFLPTATAQRRIVPDALPRVAGASPSAWIVGPTDAVRRIPWLASQALVFEHDGTALWHARSEGPAPAFAAP